MVKFESQETVMFNANISDQEKLAIMNARWTQLNSNIPNKIRNIYRYYISHKDVS